MPAMPVSRHNRSDAVVVQQTVLAAKEGGVCSLWDALGRSGRASALSDSTVTLVCCSCILAMPFPTVKRRMPSPTHRPSLLALTEYRQWITMPRRRHVLGPAELIRRTFSSCRVDTRRFPSNAHGSKQAVDVG